MTSIFKVNGMKCGGCTANVEKALAELAGVSTVKADLQQKTVVVRGEFNADEVERVIRDLGFEVD